jgi:hypothetical protein
MHPASGVPALLVKATEILYAGHTYSTNGGAVRASNPGQSADFVLWLKKTFGTICSSRI